MLISTVVRDKSLPKIPILIMSGVVGVNEIADLLDLGATKFIPKPFNMQTLRDDVISCLDLFCPLPLISRPGTRPPCLAEASRAGGLFCGDLPPSPLHSRASRHPSPRGRQVPATMAKEPS